MRSRPNLHALAAIATYGWLAVASSTQAQDLGNLLNLSLNELGQVKVTTATMTDETLKTAPSSVTVYTRRDIRELGVTRLEDLLNFVPGFQSYVPDEVSNVHAFSSRGRRTGTSGREVLILLDGQRLNSDFSGGASGTTVIPSLDNVERVEVIRGAGSSIYGSNAMLGVINIITRSDRVISLNAGSNHQREGSLQWQAGSEDAGVQLFARNGRNDGQALSEQDPLTQQQVHTRDPYQEQEVYLRGNAGDWYGSLRWSAARGEGKYVLGFADTPLNHDSETLHDALGNIGWQHSFANGWQLDNSFYVRDQAFIPESVMLQTPLVISRLDLHSRETGFRSTLQGNADPAHWLVGMEYRQPDLYRGDGYFAMPTMGSYTPKQFYEEGSHEISALFGQYQHPFESLHSELTLGARYDHDSDSGESLSPRLGLTHTINSHDSIKWLYGEAFRAPSPTETRLTSPVILSNPQLKPEKTRTTELVWMHNTRDELFTASLFHTDIHDAIIEVPSGYARSYANTQMSIDGIELEWRHHLNDNWLIRTTATDIFNPAADINSEASKLFSAALTWHAGNWSSTLAAHGSNQRQDIMDTDNNPATMEYHTLGGRTIWSGHVSWQAEPQLELYLHADNLFDKQYYSPATRYQNTEGSPERGRALTAGLRWHF